MRSAVTASLPLKGVLLVSAAIVATMGAGASTNWFQGNPEAQATSTINGSGSSTSASGMGGGNTNSNGNPPSKDFTIKGQVAGLAPGVPAKLTLTIDNPNNQDLRITGVTATVTAVTKAAGAPAGSCTTSTVSMGTWTGSAFTVGKNTSAAPVPGWVPVTMSHSAGDACRGAKYTLNYAGTAVQP